MIILMCFFALGKDKLAEILSMDSNAAKELMTSFLRKSTHTHGTIIHVNVITYYLYRKILWSTDIYAENSG